MSALPAAPLSLEDLRDIVLDRNSSAETKALCLSLAFEKGRVAGIIETRDALFSNVKTPVSP